MKNLRSRILLSAILILVLLAGCAEAASTATPTPPAADVASLLARTGRGVLHTAVYSSDSAYVLAAFDNGISILCACDMQEINYYPIAEQPLSLAFFPDGHELAVGTGDGNILFLQFSSETGTLSPASRHPLSASQASNSADDPFQVATIAIAPDGKTLAALSGKYQLQAWKLPEGKTLFSQPLYGGEEISISSNSRYMLASINLYDLGTGQVLQTFEGLPVYFLPDGEHVVYRKLEDVNWKSSMYEIFDITAGQRSQIIQLEEMEGDGSDLFYSPDGGMLLEVFDMNHTLNLYRAATGELIRSFSSQETWEDKAATFAVSDSGMTFGQFTVPRTNGFTSEYDPNSWEVDPYLVDLSQENPQAFMVDFGMPQGDLYGHDVLFSPDGKNVLYSRGNWLAELNTTTREVGYLYDNTPPGQVSALAFNPDGGSLAIGKDTGDLGIFSLKSNYITGLYDAPTFKAVARHQPSGVSGLAYFPDGGSLVFTQNPGLLNFWKTSEAEPQTSLNGGEPIMESFGLAIAPDGSSLAMGGYAQTIRVWNDPLGSSPISSLLEDSSPVGAVVYSPDGKLLATGDAQGFIRLWDLASGQLLRTLKGHTAWVNGLAFQPDGKRLFSISEDGTARIWGMDDGSQEKVLELGQAGSSLALDPRGQVLALGVQDGKVYLWNAATNGWLGSLGDGISGVSAVAFSSDGNRLAFGQSNGLVQIWEIRTGDGNLTAFSQILPSPASAAAKCEVTAGSLFTNTLTPEAVYLAGGSYDLAWSVPTGGDCTGLVSTVKIEQGGTIRAADLRVDDAGSGKLILTARVDMPAQAGTFDASWKLILPDTNFTIAARLTTVSSGVASSLPAPLYYLDRAAIMRLETDGVTRTQIVEAPVQCFDISPKDGSLAFLRDDELFLADASGGVRRTLLPIAGCPAWATDGTKIAFSLNGVKVVNVNNGTLQTLREDLNVANKDLRVYSDILGWSPFSNKFVANVNYWEGNSSILFDITNAYRTGLPGSGDIAWSRDGVYVYQAQGYFACMLAIQPSIVRTDVTSGASETLLGDLEGGETDLRGGLAPFEANDGRLYFMGVRPESAFCETDPADPRPFRPARMFPSDPGNVEYDEALDFEAVRGALWWRDGSLVVVRLGGQENDAFPNTLVLAQPFTSAQPVFLPVIGTNLRWMYIP
jgi:WD40 repeat protein